MRRGRSSFPSPFYQVQHILFHTHPSKGGIFLSASGYIQVHAYSSYAQLPLKDVAVTVTAQDGTVIAMRLTDRSGRIEPISVPTPERSESQSPDSSVIPFTVVNITARIRGYELLRNEGLQVFPDTTTDQNLEMIPLAELPDAWSQSETFQTPKQNL